MAFLGVGLRGLRRGDAALDACAVAGLEAPAKILAVFVLDVPHLVLGLTATTSVIQQRRHPQYCLPRVSVVSLDY